MKSTSSTMPKSMSSQSCTSQHIFTDTAEEQKSGRMRTRMYCANQQENHTEPRIQLLRREQA